MTNERDNPSDAGVSAAYRELADERVPASLNESILRDARAHAGRGYSGSMRWLRPMAWAATVGLSLAIVVQLTTLEQPTLDGAPATASDLPAAPPAAVGSAKSEAEADASREPKPAQRLEAASDATEALPTARSDVSGRAAGAAAEASGTNTGPSTEVAADAFVDSSAFDVDNAQVLEEARDMARQRSGPAEQVRRTVAPAAAALESKQSAQACDEASRKTPEDWQACIDELRRQGRDGEAADEAERLATAFPDFVVQ